jgi:hypothetical protein
MGQVLDTDQTQSTVTLTAPLAGAVDLTRNPRLRRWDQKEGVNASGVIPITSSPQTVALEDGIEVTVQIDGAAASAHVADWWVFWARAASGSIEELDKAPPRGIRHHFVRLAVLHGGDLSDCRVPWPGDCDSEGGDCGCTRCVTPESHQDDNGPLTIQDAIDQVVSSGGRVCLAPGRYRLERPLRIVQARGLTLAGDGAATVIEAPRRLGILVSDCIDVTLERFVLRTAEEGKSKDVERSVGIALVNTADCRVERCIVAQPVSAGSVGIGLAGWALRTRLVENVVLAGTAIGDIVPGQKVKGGMEAMQGFKAPPPDQSAEEEAGRSRARTQIRGWLDEHDARYLLTVDLAIEDNLLLGLAFGVRFGVVPELSHQSGKVPVMKPTHDVYAGLVMHAAATRIDRNLVLGGAIAGLSLLGLTLEGPRESRTRESRTSEAGLLAVAHDALLHLARIDVRENVIVAGGDGVRASLEALLVEDNSIHGRGTSHGGHSSGVAILAPTAARDSAWARVAGNAIGDEPRAGVSVSGAAGSIDVAGNRITQTGTDGIDLRGRTLEARVLDNVLQDVALSTRNGDDTLLTAIRVSGAVTVAVTGNRLRRFALDHASVARVAVSVTADDVVHVDGNQLVDIGPKGLYAGEVTGIFADGSKALDVRGNTVRIRSGADNERPASIALDVGRRTERRPQQESGGTVAERLLATEHAADWFVQRGGFEGYEPVPELLPQVAVHGNTLESGGMLPVARIAGKCNVTFAENRCRMVIGKRHEPVVLVAVEGAAIVSANHVEGPGDDLPAVVLEVGSGAAAPHATVLGNIVHGGIRLNNSGLGAPWDVLNINA